MLDWLNKTFTAEQIAVAELAVSALASLLLLAIFYRILRRSEERVKKNDGKYVERMQSSTRNYIEKMGKYESTKLFLSQYGANYMMGRHTAPEEYALINIFLALIVGIIGAVNFGIIGLLAGMLSGYNLLKGILIISNNYDNEKILYDLKGIYDTLKIKTEGGMFLISAIQECYKNARNKRLKDALSELYNELVTKSDVREAVDNFNVKFKNKYIDTFCVIIKQSLESGKAVEILSDMSEQLTDMQNAINIKENGRLETQIETIQIMVYIGMVMISMYGLLMSVSNFTL